MVQSAEPMDDFEEEKKGEDLDTDSSWKGMARTTRKMLLEHKLTYLIKLYFNWLYDLENFHKPLMNSSKTQRYDYADNSEDSEKGKSVS